ncbi:hypothetical protein [Parapedobacter sp. 10938]|uniref:hypothetical protein n=1 Tax=Parapedobacter flavus TaxID=3110225 RepID=UPI002DBA841D|nr:hypothetical protein [Parapedobacter sp. 10938]MEC3879698.1 hypothetical protein [Parapedobacter sp. 10938]
MELKKLLELHFSGTAIRDVAADFILKYNAISNEYELGGGIRQLIESPSIVAIEQKTASLRPSADTTTFAGTVYFDRYTAHAVVNVHPVNQANSVFHTVSTVLNPKGGLEAFSRRFHDFLRSRHGRETDTETVENLSTFRFLVERDGSLMPLDTGIAETLFRAFARQEIKWSPGISSGPPSRNEVTLHLITEFIRTGQGWPDEYNWVSIRRLPHFDIGEQLTYCVTSKASLPPGLVVISAIRDPMLGTYRWPMIHGGPAEAAQLLIKDIQAAFEKGTPLEHHSLYRRVYFYRDR